jgi:hypothetical protein
MSLEAKLLYKRVKQLLIISLFSLFTFQSASCQDWKLGLSYSHGSLSEDGWYRIMPRFKNAFLSNQIKSDLTYTFENKLKLSAGLNIGFRKSEFTFSNTQLNLPLTIGYKLGDKFSFQPSIGVYYSFLLEHNSNSNDPIEQNYRPHNFGLTGMLPLGYQISDRFELMIFFQHDFALTSYRSSKEGSSGGGIYYERRKSRDSFLGLGIFCLLNKQ